MTPDDIGFVACSSGDCKQCGHPAGLNEFGRCFTCSAEFVAKIRTVAIHAEPWALRQARKDGYAKY